MRIIFVGGGTSGHINPALNMAIYIKNKQKNDKILYVGTKNSLEEKLVKAAGIDFKTINISGFSRSLSFDGIYKNIKTFLKIFISDIESKKILKEFKPHVCMGTGGYVCGPFLRRAYKMKIPFVVHEQNSIPGLTTKLLAKKASKILLVMPNAKKYFKNKNCELVGNPIQDRILLNKNEAIKKLNDKYGKKFNTDKKIILSFGGSLGSSTINDIMLNIIKDSNYFHIHAFGGIGKTIFKKILENKIYKKDNMIIEEYIDNMYICMSACDLVICRSGAMTISEVAFFKKPSILIPSPNVAENHQYYNALSLVELDAASMIEEKKLNTEILKSEIEKIFKNDDISNKYSKNIKKFLIPNSNEKIYNILLDFQKNI